MQTLRHCTTRGLPQVSALHFKQVISRRVDEDTSSKLPHQCTFRPISLAHSSCYLALATSRDSAAVHGAAKRTERGRRGRP